MQLQDNKYNGNSSSTNSLTDSEWLSLVKLWEQSGIRQVEFCRQHGVAYKTFGNHRAQYLKLKPKASLLVPVKIANKPHHSAIGGHGCFQLYTPDGYRLSIPDNCNKDSLQQLLKMLRVTC